MSFVVLIPIIASVYRSIDIGWQPIFTLHISLLIITFMILIKKDSIKTQYKAFYLVSLFFIGGIAGFLQFGLLSKGFTLFVISMILSVLLLEVKYVIFFAFLTTAALSFLLINYSTSYLATGLNANEYLQLNSTWIMTVLAYVFLVVIVLLGIGYVFKVISQLILNLKEQNQLNKKLLKDRDLFFSNVSHELRTPLNAILGFSSILNRKQTDKELLELSNHIYENSTSLLYLINQVLDLSKIKDHRFTIDEYEFNAYEELEEFSRQLEGLSVKKTINYDVDIDESLNGIFWEIGIESIK